MPVKALIGITLLMLCAMSPLPAKSDLFLSQSRPWHIEQPSLCRPRVDILPGDQDWLYWQTLLPNNNRSAGLTLHPKHTNNAVSFWAELDPDVEVKMIQKGSAPYIANEIILSPGQKDAIVTRIRLRREKVIAAEKTLKKTAIVAIPLIIGYVGAPSVAAISLKKLLSTAAARAGVAQLALEILQLDDLPDRDLLAPAKINTNQIDPTRIGQFFYGKTKLARTFSILTTDGSQKWLVTQTIILGHDVQESQVLIPLYECFIPMKWSFPDQIVSPN